MTPEELRPYVEDFLELYATRPILKNDGGMKAPHCFWTYYWLRKLQPEVVIESGVFQGLSTWLIEKTLPNARIISIDVYFGSLKYKSTRAEYTTADFGTINWRAVLGPKISNTLAFIDDHQNNYERLQKAYNEGIPYLIFEDNYPTTHGDVLSLKKILSGDRYIIDVNGRQTWYTIPANFRTNIQNLCSYVESPPVYLDTNITRWGDSFQSHGCQSPIFSQLEPGWEIFKEDQLDYTFLAFVTIYKNAASNVPA